MSLTYHIVCRDCREDVWVGQDRVIYRAEPDFTAMQGFLFAHEGHALAFMETNELADLKEVWKREAANGKP